MVKQPKRTVATPPSGYVPVNDWARRNGIKPNTVVTMLQVGRLRGVPYVKKGSRYFVQETATA